MLPRNRVWVFPFHFPHPAMAETPSSVRVSSRSQQRGTAMRRPHMMDTITNGILCFSQVVIVRRLCGAPTSHP